MWSPDATRRLLRWFGRHARDLPWRRTRDPYAVWISEVMLQQTQVATVIPYFERFMARFSTVAALAAAEEDEVLRLWEGLGYYRRARQLHAAANQIVAQHDGKIPGVAAAIRALPGIGRYTAGAILSIAFDQRQPILEGNTKRLYSRLVGDAHAPNSVAGQERLWEFAAAILPRQYCGAFNQALMELGATICTPRSPRCDLCPVAAACVAFRTGRQSSIPAPPQRAAPTEVREVVVLIMRRGKFLLVRQAEHGRWGRLWDFVRFRLDENDSGEAADVIATAGERIGISLGDAELMTTLTHGVTRFRIRLSAYVAQSRSGKPRPTDGVETCWVAPAELVEYPLNITARRLAQAVGGRRQVRTGPKTYSLPPTAYSLSNT